MKNLMLIFLIINGLTACSNQKKELITGNSPTVESSNIIFDAAKRTDQNAAEVFDLGTVGLSPIVKTFTIANTSGFNITLNFTDLQSKVAATTRFSLNLATATPCSTSLKINKTCSFAITLNKVANESYDALTTNIIDPASRGANPEYGAMVFSGVKANDVSSTSVPLSAIMRIDRLADSYQIPAGGSITKRFYIGNIGTGSLKTPTVIAPLDGVISVNTCPSLPSIKPNGTCFFEIRYDANSMPEKSAYNSQITFTSSDPLIDTTGLKIDLAITNQQAIVPVISANFNQIGSIPDLSNTNSKTRLYVNNTGSSSLNTATISIPSQFTISGTSCSAVLKVGKTCFFDLIISLEQTSNNTAVIAPIKIGATLFNIKAGDPALVNIPNPVSTCKAGYEIKLGLCVALDGAHFLITDGNNSYAISESFDSGVHYQPLDPNGHPAEYTVGSILVDGSNMAITYTDPANGYAHLFTSTNKGVNLGSEVILPGTIGISLMALSGNNIILNGYDSSYMQTPYLISRDMGLTFSNLIQGSIPSDAYITMVNMEASKIIVETYDFNLNMAVVYVSNNSGIDFSQLQIPDGINVGRMIPHNNKIFMTESWDNTLGYSVPKISLDNGATYNNFEPNGVPADELKRIVSLQAHGTKIIIKTYTNAYLSLDDGNSFNLVPLPSDLGSFASIFLF